MLGVVFVVVQSLVVAGHKHAKMLWPGLGACRQCFAPRSLLLPASVGLHCMCAVRAFERVKYFVHSVHSGRCEAIMLHPPSPPSVANCHSASACALFTLHCVDVSALAPRLRGSGQHQLNMIVVDLISIFDFIRTFFSNKSIL